MKIRHRRTGVEVEGVFFHQLGARSIRSIGSCSVYDVDTWELVLDPKPKTWRDVTHECDLEAGGRKLVHEDEVIFYRNAPGYRLREVNVKQLYGAGEHHSAFIIEKEEA